MTPFIGNIQNRQVPGDKKQISGCQGLVGGRNGEWLLVGVGFLSRDNENVLE